MANVVVEMSGDEAKLYRSMQKIIEQQAKMDAKNRDLEKSSGKAGKSMEGMGKNATAGFGSQALAKVTSFAAGMVTLSTVTGAYNNLLEENRQLALQAAAAQGTLAKAQQEAIKNMTGMSTKDKQKTLAGAVSIQKKTGFPSQAELTNAIGAGIGSSGDAGLTLKAVEAAARLTPLSPADVGVVSAGALDVARGSGLDDAERNLGFLLSAGGPNRIDDPVKMARNLAPLVSSGTTMFPGQDRLESSREIGGLFAAMTKLSTDVKGESSATNQAMLMSKLDQFFGEDSGRKDPGSLYGRIEAIQRDKNMRDEFLGTEGFGEAKYKPIMKNMLTGGTEAAQLLKDMKKEVNFDAGTYKQTVKEIEDSTPALKLAKAQSSSEATLENLQLGSNAGREGTARKIMTDTLQKTRSSNQGLANALFGESLSGFGFDANMHGQDPEARAIGSLVKRRHQIMGKKSLAEDLGAPIDKPTVANESDLKKLPEGEQEKVRAIDDQIRLLVELQKQATEAQKQAAADVSSAAAKLTEVGPQGRPPDQAPAQRGMIQTKRD